MDIIDDKIVPHTNMGMELAAGADRRWREDARALAAERARAGEVLDAIRAQQKAAFEALVSERGAEGLVVCFPGNRRHGEPCPAGAKIIRDETGRWWAHFGPGESAIVVEGGDFCAAERAAKDG